MNKIAFIVVTWNSSATIEECLKSLDNQGASVIVVDNNSSDDTVDKVKQDPWVQLIRNKVNLGFSAANNIALKEIGSEFIFLLNPDAQLGSSALAEIIKFMEKNKDVGILGPKLLNADGSVQKEITSFPGLLDQILILLRLHRLPILDNFVYPNYDYDAVQEAEHLMGSALLIRKEVFA